MSPNYYILPIAYLLTGRAEAVPSFKLRGAWRPPVQDEGDGWSLPTTFQHAQRLSEKLLAQDLSPRLPAVSTPSLLQTSVASSGQAEAPGRIIRAPRTLSSLVKEVSISSDGDMHDQDMVAALLQEGSLDNLF
eukprot:TRINITY_DN75797_c0_g1_i1.p1 TRINITY_DN75797_c0_g1~~TRINITY_DN75797_c0_g1_i1.p1  ORF type:complete len:133 (-),score=17.81 TRINITY_DN75797_c0_g1_i1:109-507(-)